MLALAAGHLLLGEPVAARAEEPEASPAPRVGHVRFHGVKSVSRSELDERVLTSGRGWKFWTRSPEFEEETLREDLDRIGGFYRERGYYEASAIYTLGSRAEGTRVDIDIDVEEGLPVRVAGREVAIADAAGLDAAAIEGVKGSLGLEVGDVFGIAAYNQAKEELRLRLGNLGHPAAHLTGGVDVDLVSHEASIRWEVDPGPLIHFGEISVEGLERVASEIVERELQLREGDVFSNDRLRATQRRVYGLDLFRSVEVLANDPKDGSSAWPVTVRVRERDPRSVRIAIGYGTEDQFRTRVTWLHRNFLGGTRRLSTSARYSSLRAGADVRFVQPRFPDSSSTFEVDSALLRETPPAFTSLGVNGGLRVTRPLAGPWSASVGYRVDFRDVEDADPSDLGQTLLSFFQVGLTRNTLDDRLRPTRGTWLELSAEPSLRGIGSDVDYVMLRAEARWFQKLGFAVLATRVRWGATPTFGASETADVPIFKRFYSGGSSSVRGFRYQRLGPRDTSGEPIGGLSLAEANVELRFPIWKMVSGVAFLDTGQVQREPFDLRFDAFRSSAGPGLRIETPIGDLRVDYGWLLNPPQGEDPGRFHLSIGHAF